MSGFNGKAFLLAVAHLDAPSRVLFHQHGTQPTGHLSLVEHIADEALLRLAGNPEIGHGSH